MMHSESEDISSNYLTAYRGEVSVSAKSTKERKAAIRAKVAVTRQHQLTSGPAVSVSAKSTKGRLVSPVSCVRFLRRLLGIRLLSFWRLMHLLETTSMGLEKVDHV